MTVRIFRSVFFTSVVILLVGVILIYGVLYSYFDNQIKKELESEADYIEYALYRVGDVFFDSLNKGDKRITLISSDGEVIADTYVNPNDMDNHIGRTEIKEAMHNGTGTSIRYSNTLTQKTIYYARRLNDGRIIRVSTNQHTVISIIAGLVRPIIIIILLALVISFALSSKLSRDIVRPINEINLDSPDESKIYDEISPFIQKIKLQKRTIAHQMEAARQKQEEFKLITDNMSEGFIIIDKSADILSYNAAALRLLNTDDGNGRIFTKNHSREFVDAINSSLDGKSYEATMSYNNCIYSIITNPVFKGDEVIGAVIMIIDATERHRLENIKREFAANVSHELKTPLTSISGFAELMKNGDISEEFVMDFSQSIYNEAQRLICLVNDIIKISRLDEKTEKLEEEFININGMIEDITDRLNHSARKKNLSISFDGDSCNIYGVRQIVDEMIYNICDNAVKYNNINGSIDIKAENKDNCVIITISDTGIGIPKSEQDRVFERFYRVDKSRSKSEGGTGLGLSIVKHGALYHNADVVLKSEEGKGTSVALVFKK